MIVVEEIKKNEEVLYTNCSSGCEEGFIFRKLKIKESIKIICPCCNAEITIKCMANGKMTRKWKSGKK